jgi:hypothetical protein
VPGLFALSLLATVTHVDTFSSLEASIMAIFALSHHEGQGKP